MSKYNRSLHVPGSPGTTSDDRIAESVDTLLNQYVIISEKLDGSNTGLTKPGVYGRSHAAFTTNPWDVKVRELHSLLKHSIDEDLYLFGEGMEAIHSIEYENLTSVFYLFGARYHNIWSSWDDVELYAGILNIPTVPVLFRGIFQTKEELNKKILELVEEPSALGGQREGIVIRLAREFTDDEFSTSLMKWVRKNHVKTDEHWQKHWRKAYIKYG